MSRFVRQAVAHAVAGTPAERTDLPSEEELLDLLAEKARQGNVAAIRSLLAREEEQDPQRRTLELFRQMAANRQ